MIADELVYTRVLSGPRPFVFACLTEARHLAAFWGPAGTTTPTDGIVVEPRPGGRFETLIVNDADGSTHHMRAVFDEVDPPHTLSWTGTLRDGRTLNCQSPGTTDHRSASHASSHAPLQ